MEGKIEYRHDVDCNPKFTHVPSYVYGLRIEGDFFNEENIKLHKIIGGEYLFSKKEDRDEFIDKVTKSYNTFSGIGDIKMDCAEGHDVYKKKGIKFVFKCVDDDKPVCLECPLPLSFTIDIIKTNINKIYYEAKTILDKNKEYELVSAVLYGEWDVSKMM